MRCLEKRSCNHGRTSLEKHEERFERCGVGEVFPSQFELDDDGGRMSPQKESEGRGARSHPGGGGFRSVAPD